MSSDLTRPGPWARTAGVHAAAGVAGGPVTGPLPRPEYPLNTVPSALAFVVYGLPAPQGSKRVVHHGGTPRQVEMSSGLEAWRETVREVSRRITAGMPGWAPLDEPVLVAVTFTMSATKAATARGDRYQWSDPDCDKLLRALGDALGPKPPDRTVGQHLPQAAKKQARDAQWAAARRFAVLHDDKYIAAWHAIQAYPGTVPGAMTHPGAAVEIWRLAELHQAM